MNRAQYEGIVRTLNLVASWALGTVRHTFADAWVSYTVLEPAASRFGDDVLRGSALESLGRIVVALATDSQRLTGVAGQLFGEETTGLLALNPGHAKGHLRILTAAELASADSVARDEIVLLPETVADLPLVAGLLTLGEGNPVSHVQLLARNFGIPNVRIDAAAADRLVAAVSQPSMVRLLAALENAVGVRLINRTTRRMALTDEGREYYERCKLVLAAVDDAESSLTARRAEPRGRLRITSSVTFGRALLAPLVADFMAAHPQLRVELVLLDRVIDLIERAWTSPCGWRTCLTRRWSRCRWARRAASSSAAPR